MPNLPAIGPLPKAQTGQHGEGDEQAQLAVKGFGDLGGQAQRADLQGERLARQSPGQGDIGAGAGCRNSAYGQDAEPRRTGGRWNLPTELSQVPERLPQIRGSETSILLPGYR